MIPEEIRRLTGNAVACNIGRFEISKNNAVG